MGLNNIKIGTRLGLGFGIILALMGIATVVTFVSLQLVDQRSLHVSEESLPFTLMAARMAQNTIEVQLALTDASLTHNAGDFDKAETHSLGLPA